MVTFEGATIAMGSELLDSIPLNRDVEGSRQVPVHSLASLLETGPARQVQAFGGQSSVDEHV